MPELFSEERTVATAALAVLTAGAFVAVAGTTGALAGIGVLAAWYLLDSTYAFGLGQVGVAALVPEGALTGLVVLEAGLFGLLLVPIARRRDGIGPIAVAIAWTAVWGLVVWASAVGAVGLSVVVGGLVGATALAAYGLHRYQRVELGGVAGE